MMDEVDIERVNLLVKEGCTDTAIHIRTGIDIELIKESFKR